MIHCKAEFYRGAAVYSCSRVAKCGDYCAQHHPANVAARRSRTNAATDVKVAKMIANRKRAAKDRAIVECVRRHIVAVPEAGGIIAADGVRSLALEDLWDDLAKILEGA